MAGNAEERLRQIVAGDEDRLRDVLADISKLANSDIDHDTALEMAEWLGKNHAQYDYYMESLSDQSLPARDGIKVVMDLEVEDYMLETPGWIDQWNYWKETALVCAALNYKDGEPRMPTNTEEHIGDVYAKHFMTTGPFAAPHFNIAVAAMKFATHQVMHALGRVHGLPYPNPDGTRSYNTPGPAVETAATGSSALEREMNERWPKFIETTAERVGFDMKNIT